MYKEISILFILAILIFFLFTYGNRTGHPYMVIKPISRHVKFADEKTVRVYDKKNGDIISQMLEPIFE